MSDIFLSYSRSNKYTAQRLAETLDRRGWSVFWDSQIRTAEDFEERIRSEAEAAGCVVVLWSQDSVVSDWVLREAEIGMHRERLLPALIEDASPPEEFAKLQAVDLRGWAPDTLPEGFKVLLMDIVGKVGPEPWKWDAFEASLRNIARFGDTDVLPYPIEKVLFSEDRKESLELLCRIDVKFEAFKKSYRPYCEASLYPVGFFGFRWVTQIDPVWNAYLLGLVTAAGERIEAVRSRVDKDTVFSYRFNPDQETGALFDKEIGWTQYQERSLALAEKLLQTNKSPQVVVCDIADFYARISHEHVREALKRSRAAPEIVERIVDLLGIFSGGDPYGLPIGGPASRLLSELVLHSVDTLLITDGVTFCRFADDYHVFATDERDAYQRLMLLSNRLYGRLGLTLQKSKTRIMSAEEFIATARLSLAEGAGAERHGEGDRWTLLRLKIPFDPYNEEGSVDLPAAKQQYDEFRREINKYDLLGMLARELTKSRPDPALTRRLIDGVKYLDPQNRNIAVKSLLDTGTLERLYPLLSNLLRTFKYLVEPRAEGGDGDDTFDLEARPWPGYDHGLDEDTRRKVFHKLAELIGSGSYLMGIPAYLAYAVRVLAHDPSSSTDKVLADAYNKTDSHMVRRDIILAMARRRNEEWIRFHFGEESDLTTWEKRALLIASTTLGSFGRNWRLRMADRTSPMDLLALEWVERRTSVNDPGTP